MDRENILLVIKTLESLEKSDLLSDTGRKHLEDMREEILKLDDKDKK